jgi:predicted Zn finger-like uncharacterized protein
MILSCPACSTRFLVAATALGSGRRVRCAKCQHNWFATPPDDAPPPARLVPSALPDDRPPTDPVLTAPRYPVPAVKRPGPRRWVVAGWAGLAAAVLLTLVVLGTARESIVSAWPRAARLYALAGVAAEPPGAGLEFRQVSSARADENGTPALVVEGEVANISGVSRGVPNLAVVLHDRERRAVQRWVFEPPRRELPPGGATPFKTTIPRPSEAATGLVVTLADGA